MKPIRSCFDYIRSHKWLEILLALVVFLLLLGLVAWNRFDAWYDSSLEPIAAYGDDKIFDVKTGQTADEIAENLVDVGLISSSRAFLIHLDREGIRGSMQAGTYRLNPAMSSQDIADIIANGKIDTRLITILPGLRLDEIQESLINDDLAAADVQKALNKNYDHPLLAEKPSGSSLEGYIFPESFQINSQSSAEEIVVKSFDVFWAQIDDSMLEDIKGQGLNFHEAVTLASIVGLESSDPETQKKIAQVFIRRLNEGIPLGADPTFRYASAINGVEDSVVIDSPYNTRIYEGLPPGPIGNFTITALEAVADPADGDYLFFVAGDDGITRFSHTVEEHEALAEQYCIDLCQL